MVGRGRPKLNNAQRKVLQVRVLPDVKKIFEEAARLSDLSLSSWARERLLVVAMKELQDSVKKADESH